MPGDGCLFASDVNYQLVESTPCNNKCSNEQIDFSINSHGIKRKLINDESNNNVQPKKPEEFNPSHVPMSKKHRVSLERLSANIEKVEFELRSTCPPLKMKPHAKGEIEGSASDVH